MFIKKSEITIKAEKYKILGSFGKDSQRLCFFGRLNMFYQGRERNMIRLLITLVVITVFLCQNVGLAENGQRGQYYIVQSKLAPNSFLADSEAMRNGVREVSEKLRKPPPGSPASCFRQLRQHPRGFVSLSSLAQILGVAQSTVSEDMRILIRAGLAEKFGIGEEIVYMVDPVIACLPATMGTMGRIQKILDEEYGGGQYTRKRRDIREQERIITRLRDVFNKEERESMEKIRICKILEMAYNAPHLYLNTNNNIADQDKMAYLIELVNKYQKVFYSYVQNKRQFKLECWSAHQLVGWERGMKLIVFLLGRVKEPESSRILLEIFRKRIPLSPKGIYPRGISSKWISFKDAVILALINLEDRRFLPYVLQVIYSFEEDASTKIPEEWPQLKERWFGLITDKFGEDYVEFINGLVVQLEKLRKSAAEIVKNRSSETIEELFKNSEKDVEGLGDFIKKKPEYFKDLLYFVLYEYRDIGDEVSYIISKMGLERDGIQEAIISMIQEESFSQVHDLLAVILSNWTNPLFAADETLQNKAYTVLANLLGKERAAFFDKYGVWVIDIGAQEELRFTNKDLATIEEALNCIPQEHLDARVVWCIVRGDRGYPSERIDSEGYNDGKYKVPDGFYKRFNRMVIVCETYDIRRVIFHEFGHGVHFYYTGNKECILFAKCHKMSKAVLADANDEEGTNSLFACKYGQFNVYEDFATLYEMLLADVFTKEDNFRDRVKDSNMLKMKLFLVAADQQGRLLPFLEWLGLPYIKWDSLPGGSGSLDSTETILVAV